MADDHKDDVGKEFERLDRDVHRLILERINSARRPEDLRDLELDEPESKEPRIARSLLEHRNLLGPFGFTHLKELEVIRGINRKLIDILIRLCGPAARGKWDTPYETQLPDGTPYHVAHAIVLRTGKVLFLPEANLKTTMLWDPSDLVNPQFEFMVDQPDEFLFCTGHAQMTDGRVLVAGGGGGGPSGVNRAYKFDPVAKTWTRTGSDMSQARWYPTLVTLADDCHILVVGGAPSNNTTEIYDEATDSFAMMTGPNSTRSFPQLYPGLHLLPTGEVFYSRTGFGSAGPGAGGAGDPLNTNAFLRFSGPTTGAWNEIADIAEFPDRVRGMSVLLGGCDPHMAHVLVVGGTSAPGSETSQMIHLSTLTPAWEMPMNVPGGVARNNVSAVLLPDGNVFVCGGTADPSAPCAMFDHEEDSWTEMARLNYRKQYHSVAVLLPSGKVAATGGSNFGGGSNVIEIFSPPYLFKGPRPQINSVPAQVNFGAKFGIESPNADDIKEVVLVRPMAVTHQTDTEQRVVELPFTRKGHTLKAKAPNPHVPHHIPRGYYMLFILNGKGVPSEGKFIRIH
jgi:Galactose oxidase-like, Early set domain